MGTRSQAPDTEAEVPAVPAQPGKPPGAAKPDPAPADVESELASQLDELDRCLARMDAVVSMLEADLERRTAAWQALAPQILSTFADVVEAEAVDVAERTRQPNRGRRRAASARGGRASHGR